MTLWGSSSIRLQYVRIRAAPWTTRNSLVAPCCPSHTDVHGVSALPELRIL